MTWPIYTSFLNSGGNFAPMRTFLSYRHSLYPVEIRALLTLSSTPTPCRDSCCPCEPSTTAGSFSPLLTGRLCLPLFPMKTAIAHPLPTMIEGDLPRLISAFWKLRSICIASLSKHTNLRSKHSNPPSSVYTTIWDRLVSLSFL